jgi:hypothetical protein
MSSIFDRYTGEELGQMILDGDPRLKGIMAEAKRENARRKREKDRIDAEQKLQRMRAARGLTDRSRYR